MSEELLNLIINKLENIDLKLNLLEKNTNKSFEKIDGRIKEGQNFLLRRQFDLEDKIDKKFDLMFEKEDKMLSHIDYLIKTTENIKEDISVMTSRVREHEDKLEALS